MLAAKGTPDNRLAAVNEAQGVNTQTGTDGAFAIQEDFAGTIIETAATTGDILSRVDSYTSGAASNAVRFMTCDETDVSESVYGGVQAYWASEAASVNASKPKFYETKIDLEKLMAFIYITDEALEDMPFMSGLLNNAMATAANRLLEGAVVDGDGVGKPLGILHAPSLVTVDKESAQTEILTFKNIARMYGRKLIMDTLSGAYEDAATAFYKNNEQLVKSRTYQTQVTDTMAKLGEASQTAKDGVMQLLGAQEDGSYRSRSRAT